MPAPAMTSGSSNGWTSVRPVASLQLRQAHERLGRAGGLEIDGRAVPAGRGDLQLGGAGPHHDQGVDAVDARGEGDRLGVVPRRDRDHAPRPFGLRERAQLVERPARLEGARPLEELALQPGTERARGQERGPQEVGLDDRPGPEHVVAVNHAAAPPRRG